MGSGASGPPPPPPIPPQKVDDTSLMGVSVLGNYHKLGLCLCASIGLQLIMLLIWLIRGWDKWWGLCFLPTWFAHAVAIATAVVWLNHYRGTFWASGFRPDVSARQPFLFIAVWLAGALLSLASFVVLAKQLSGATLTDNNTFGIVPGRFHWQLILALWGMLVLIWVVYLIMVRPWYRVHTYSPFDPEEEDEESRTFENSQSRHIHAATTIGEQDSEHTADFRGSQGGRSRSRYGF